jgi:hypothetical protein
LRAMDGAGGDACGRSRGAGFRPTGGMNAAGGSSDVSWSNKCRPGLLGRSMRTKTAGNGGSRAQRSRGMVSGLPFREGRTGSLSRGTGITSPRPGRRSCRLVSGDRATSMPASKLYHALRLRREKGWLAVLSPRALRVDDALLEHYNWRQGKAWPGYETLCHDTGLSRDSVREAQRELEFYRRWIIHRAPRRSNEYRLPPELVPDVPAVRYVPSARWTRRERLVGLRDKVGQSQSRASHGLESRASRPLQSRATQKLQSSALGRNYALNYAVEQRNELRSDTDKPFHSHQNGNHHANGEGPHKDTIVRRYRALLEQLGNDPEARDGVVRGLAGALRCSEGEAGALLRAAGSTSGGSR